jgi:hypothetical protein
VYAIRLRSRVFFPEDRVQKTITRGQCANRPEPGECVEIQAEPAGEPRINRDGANDAPALWQRRCD